MPGFANLYMEHEGMAFKYNELAALRISPSDLL